MDDLRPFLSRRPDGRCRLMGVLNVTPDSFHAASRVDIESAIEQGMTMWADGADWIDAVENLPALALNPSTPPKKLRV